IFSPKRTAGHTPHCTTLRRNHISPPDCLTWVPRTQLFLHVGNTIARACGGSTVRFVLRLGAQVVSWRGHRGSVVWNFVGDEVDWRRPASNRGGGAVDASCGGA